ncbi:MAG: sodium:solute symporter family protein [Gammaproteobacteria bacterium]
MASAHFLALFLGLAVCSLLIGLYASKHIHTQADYYLASRTVKTLPLALTLAATQIGGGLILGTAEQAYMSGIYGLAYAIGVVLSFVFLSMGFASKLRSFNIVTTAQLFENIYQSKLLRKIASLLIVSAMWGILIGQVVATRKFIFGLGIETEWVFLLFWAFVILYTVAGGLKAVILTDIYQVTFIILLFTVIFIVTLISYPVTTLDWQPQFNFDGQYIIFINLMILPILFCIVEQDIAQRCFAAKSKKIATISTLIAAIIVLFFGFIPVYFGVLANSLNITVGSGASALVVLMEVITTPFVMVLVTLALLVAIISTADSLLCAISSNLAQDFGIKVHGKRALNLARLTTLICGTIALSLSYHFDNILAVFMQSIELPISALFISIFFGCIKQRVYRTAAYLSVFTGIIAFAIFKLIDTNLPTAFAPILLSLLAYLIGWWWEAKQIKLKHKVL